MGMKQVLKSSLCLLPTLAVTVFGILALGWMMLTADAGKGLRAQVGVIVPPWQQGGLGAAASMGLPIVDLRWAGHLVILSTDRQPDARARLQDAGYFVINTDLPPMCSTKANVNV